MRIFFTGYTNKKYCMINTATFRLANGSTVIVDRDETDYDIEDGELSMTWYNCYLWTIDGINVFDNPAYLSDDAAELFETAELISINVEDDAEEDYTITIDSWSM